MAKARRGRRRPNGNPASSEPPLRAHWRADGGEKRRYRTADEANRAALHHRLEDGADLDPYQCPYCHEWHLASRDS
jgi:hypothetical protein